MSLVICVHPKCRRDDLPPAPALPVGARLPCAHVRPDGEPCAESPYGAYDDEALEVIRTEPALWDDDVRPELLEAPEVGEPVEGIDVDPPLPPIAARTPGKPDRRETAKRRLDDKSKAAAAPMTEVQTRIAARMRELQKDSPAKPASPAAPRAAKKKADVQNVQAQVEAVDVDDWEP